MGSRAHCGISGTQGPPVIGFYKTNPLKHDLLYKDIYIHLFTYTKSGNIVMSFIIVLNSTRYRPNRRIYYYYYY